MNLKITFVQSGALGSSASRVGRGSIHISRHIDGNRHPDPNSRFPWAKWIGLEDMKIKI